MAVKIRLKRMGKIRQPYYRVVVVDARKKRDGLVIEEIGKYQAKAEPSLIDLTSDRAQYWLGVGAQPSEAVEALLKVTGDWQKFKGLPGSEGTLRTAEAKREKAEIFNEALKESSTEPKSEAVTKKAPAKKAAPAEPAAEASTPAEAETKPEAPKPTEPAVAAGESPEAAAASGDAEGEAQPTEASATEAAGTDAPAAEAPAGDDTTGA